MKLRHHDTFMGQEVVYEFIVDVTDWGELEDPQPEIYVDSCVVQGHRLTGAHFEVVARKFTPLLIQDILDNAAEQYWTEVWSGAC